ncbi:MAG: haloacid dehalogenase [Actinomycetota bacterium]|nr:haloacid dehalogenase [Actinomycetota bacterium]
MSSEGAPEQAPDLLRVDLATVVESVRTALGGAHAAREAALRSCREAIRHSSLSIRSVHRLDPDGAASEAGLAEVAVRSAQEVLAPYPRLAAAGFLHDAEKEYAEALLTRCLVAGGPLPGPDAVGVSGPAWLNGLAEAASELRRHLLDRLRDGELGRGKDLLAAMEACYDVLVTVDWPDAVTGGLRRTTDALRAVLERSRADVTTTIVQERLRRAVEGLGGVGPPVA